MGMTIIDAKTLKKAFLAGAQNLEAKKEWINELNVFPVPDGDTGTNMTMTIMSAAREVTLVLFYPSCSVDLPRRSVRQSPSQQRCLPMPLYVRQRLHTRQS